MDLIDSHCHLDFARLGDLELVLAQADNVGVAHFVVPSVDKNNWLDVLSLSKRYPQIDVALGIHPYFLSADNQVSQLERLAHQQRDNIVAIGEVGLDGIIDVSLEQQLSVLIPQIKLASELDLPLICHAHKAYDPLLKQLRRFKVNAGGVIHGFSGSLVQAQAFIKLGFKLGVGGVVTYQRAKKTRAVFSDVGLDHLVLETDSPDMPIYGRQGQVNTPSNIKEIAVELAALTEASIEQVAQITTKNSRKLFKLAAPIVIKK